MHTSPRHGDRSRADRTSEVEQCRLHENMGFLFKLGGKELLLTAARNPKATRYRSMNLTPPKLLHGKTVTVTK